MESVKASPMIAAPFRRKQNCQISEGSAALNLITDASDANTAQLSLTYLQGVLMSYFQSMNEDVKMPWSVNMKSRMFYKTFLGDSAQYRNAIAHFFDKGRGDGSLYSDQILFFMIVPGAKNFIDNIPIIGQQDQTLTVFVQTANRENALWVIDKVDNIVLLSSGIGGAHNSAGFVKGQIYRFCFRGVNEFPVEANFVFRGDLTPHFGNHPVDGDPFLLDKFVGGSARTVSYFTEILIDANLFVVFHEFVLPFLRDNTLAVRWIIIRFIDYGLQ